MTNATIHPSSPAATARVAGSFPAHATPRTDESIQLQQKLARVQSLLEAARKVHSTIRLDEVLSGVLELAAKELEAQGSFLASSWPLLGGTTRVYGTIPDSAGRWGGPTRSAGYSSAPLTDELGGTLAHLVVYRTEPLSLEEEDFLEGLALQSAVAVKNARHHERMVEWERVKMDLEAARAIQRSLLPQSTPAIDGYSLSFRSTPCYEVGGDYVDIVPLADGRLMMVLADVAGKGLASALVSMTFRSSFRAICGAGLPLEEMAARLNTLHWQEGAEARRRYVTALVVCLDPRTHTIEAVNAGHNPAFLAGRGDPAMIGASGPPLGLLPHRRYESVTFPLDEGGRMLLYTDGLTEVFREEEEFGEGRLLALLADKPSGDFLDHVWSALENFAGATHQTDDMTALYLCRKPAGGAS